MKWYPYLYVGEGASKKKNKIIRKLKIGAGMIDVMGDHRGSKRRGSV